MNFKMFAVFILPVLLLSSTALAEEPQKCIAPEGQVCLDVKTLTEVKEALKELKSIHESPVIITTDDKVVIIRDYDGRIYVDGGDKKPIKITVKIGDTINRKAEVTLPTTVSYREKKDPMFRLRVRAQAGLLLPELAWSLNNPDKRTFWDAWLSLDFFHIGIFNVSVNAGINSVSAGVGLDLTKNFGVTSGYALTYSGLRSSMFVGTYFSFN